MTGQPRHIAVIDIGKTNAKLALVDLASPREIDHRRMLNAVLADGPYPHHDVDRLWRFILDGLAELRQQHPIDALTVTTHGATAALLDSKGGLALPVLDYEHGGPDALASDYDAVRPDFSESGSPRLPAGLNLGAQLFWQSRAFPSAFANVAAILAYPQYWAWRLTGIAANEVTSLGCHTDLWDPAAGDFSSLVDHLGWRALMAPVRPAGDALGPVLPDIAEYTGLEPTTPVLCGIHDSNASLLPHLLSRRPPFSVVSTGTWVVAMAVGGKPAALDPERDTLINVSASGSPVPSARFMGGREYALLTEGLEEGWTEDDVAAVLSRGILLLPSVQQGSGPFPKSRTAWVADGEISSGERQVAASFYLAMMTAVCLDLIGADGVTVTEGPFAANGLFLRMLSAATGRGVVADPGSATGTSIGAALLAMGSMVKSGKEDEIVEGPGRLWSSYGRRWAAEIERRKPPA
ncbi:FGGY-family carbohydrate kinase [Nitratireductor luteus]|uniref:FGGY-family carbohydrate kinase n=1 Tax=Nitratireductor luteus TaxID=2976980 RepID=UPI00223F1193|nr:FGGY-family carbohydrate kinase [Nitratireductor luteus]